MAAIPKPSKTAIYLLLAKNIERPALQREAIDSSRTFNVACHFKNNLYAKLSPNISTQL